MKTITTYCLDDNSLIILAQSVPRDRVVWSGWVNSATYLHQSVDRLLQKGQWCENCEVKGSVIIDIACYVNPSKSCSKVNFWVVLGEKSVGFIPWGPWVSAPKWIIIHLLVLDIFPYCPKWWINVTLSHFEGLKKTTAPMRDAVVAGPTPVLAKFSFFFINPPFYSFVLLAISFSFRMQFISVLLQLSMTLLAIVQQSYIISWQLINSNNNNNSVFRNDWLHL